MARTMSRAKVMLAATKRLPLRTERQIAAGIEDNGFTAAEAYVVGAEEAQAEIIRRLSQLPDYPTTNVGDEHG